MRTEPSHSVSTKPLRQTEVPPVTTRRMDDGTLFMDFGKAAFGTLRLPAKGDGRESKRVIHLGEQRTPEGRLERSPAGTIRYIRIDQALGRDRAGARAVIPPDPRNTGPSAIKMPAEIGNVFPFRYAEIEKADGIDAAAIRQIRVHYPFDDDASSFHASDGVLNAVWDLCKYSIKATTFCGVYVDGDRERIPYEGDAYIQQLGHYGVDHEYALARYTHEYLIRHPTWPTEWHLHSVMMAWADYMYTGETTSLETFYDDLCAKTLIDLAREDGLISTTSGLCTRAFEKRLHLHRPDSIFGGLRDLVDWPPASLADGGQGERDHHEMRPVNTVVNAFHGHALALMSRMALVLGRPGDHARFARQADLVRGSIGRLLFDGSRGVYVDGEGSRHASLHSNMFMLAFGLVPDPWRDSVLAFVTSRGMRCSVYGAQHLLEALYLNGAEQYALELMTSTQDRSWWNMIRSGSTITMEAWDLKYKKNLDWNHAWGAAPANIIPRFVLGVRPLEPGFRKMVIQPQPGSLAHLSGTVPTIRGPVAISLETSAAGLRAMRVTIPADTTAQIRLKPRGNDPARVVVDGMEADARLTNGHLVLDDIKAGPHELVYA